MALYHFHVAQISRGKGQTVVSAAAYRAGEKLHDDYYGETADYTGKRGVITSEIMAPDYVPGSFRDRETLWNAVEACEKHPKAQLAYSFDIALMNELSEEENWQLAKQFVQENFVSRGMICDVAFHKPEKDGIENPHFHVISPIRPMKEDGSWGDKQHREYLTNENGEPILNEKGSSRFNAVSTTDWGRPETLEEWREAWARLVNETLHNKGINAAIDHRSYRDRGIDIIPQIHEGPRVRQMEKKGVRTSKGDTNRLIQNINKGIKSLQEKLKNIIEAVAEISRELREHEREVKAPTLYDCIKKYFDERNAVASSYAYGSRKACVTNVKKLSKLLIFLQENNITTVDELMNYACGMRAEANALAKESNGQRGRISEIKEILRYNAWYQEGLPIIKKISKTKFTKQKEEIKSENRDALNRFYVARRILTEQGLIGKVNPEALKNEMSELEGASKEKYDKYKKLTADVKQLSDICMYSQKALHQKKDIKREVPSL